MKEIYKPNLSVKNSYYHVDEKRSIPLYYEDFTFEKFFNEFLLRRGLELSLLSIALSISVQAQKIHLGYLFRNL